LGHSVSFVARFVLIKLVMFIICNVPYGSTLHLICTWVSILAVHLMLTALQHVMSCLTNYTFKCCGW